MRLMNSSLGVPVRPFQAVWLPTKPMLMMSSGSGRCRARESFAAA